MRIARVLATLAVGFAGMLAIPSGPAYAATLPAYDHIVVVVEENHSYGEIIGNANAPYITSLANNGAKMTQSFAVTHPSEPNYLALFSGSTQGLTDDSCPHTYSAENLGHQLTAAGKTFKGYSESMPSDGYTGCSSASTPVSTTRGSTSPTSRQRATCGSRSSRPPTRRCRRCRSWYRTCATTCTTVASPPVTPG